MISDRFRSIMKIVLKFENGNTACGYVNDPKDMGGETVSGITRKNHPSLSIWAKLDELEVADKKKYKPTKEEWDEIYNIYYKNYYKPIKGDYFKDDNVALALMDMAVNAGVTTAVKLLQRMLHISADGIVGPKTIGTADVNKNTADRYKDERINYYKSLVAKRPSNQKFLNGWIKRATNCHF